MMRLLSTLSLAAAVAAASAAPVAAQTTKAPAPRASAKPAKPAAKKAGAAGRTVKITVGDNIKFSLTSIEAKPSETIHVVLKSTGTMPKIAMAHNFVLLKAGVDATKFSQDATKARDTDYVPAARKADILASTKLAGPGETVEVTFMAPAKAGVYPYLCTFPGHYAAGMRGELTVK